jgi:menaquinone-dependent protoporphyrinogen IX oxidase
MKVLILAASRHGATTEIADAIGVRLRGRGPTRPQRAQPPERLVTKVVHAPDGDFRDWDDVARWSDEIADDLA